MSMLPKDPAMLQSYLNTLLRDRYESLGDLADGLDLDPGLLEKALQDAGLQYDSEKNALR